MSVTVALGVGINAREGETQERVRQLRERWESEIRPRLLAVRGGWFAVELSRGGDILDMRETAKQDHEEASRLAEELAEAIRGEGV